MRNTRTIVARMRALCAPHWLRATQLRRNQDGATAIEFAAVAPLFFFLMFVIAETALIFIAEQVMDNAVFESTRLVRTGQVQKGEMTQAEFKADICGRMAVFIDCDSSDFYLDVKCSPTFADMQAEPPLKDDETFEEEGEYAFGGESQIIVVRAYYQWPTNKIFGPLSLGNMSNGKRMIGSFAAFKNEPFGPAPKPC